MGTGGIFVAGIAGKIVAKMKEPGFMESFLDKGRMRSLLEAVPVKIVLNDDSGLIRRSPLHAGAESLPGVVSTPALAQPPKRTPGHQTIASGRLVQAH